MSITIKGLDHVVLRVADLDRAIRFYCEVLGCTEERRIEPLGLVQLRGLLMPALPGVRRDKAWRQARIIPPVLLPV